MTAATDPAGIALQAPRRRRRLGVMLIVVGVSLTASQSFFEWQMPYDLVALHRVQAALGLPQLRPQSLSLGWAALCALGLAAMQWAPMPSRRAGWLAFATGLVLGSARLAAGGAVAAVVVLLLAGVASLGWQSLRQGGLALLGGTVLAIVGWDALLSSYSTLWPVCAALAAMFVWIERQHIQVTEQQLIAALTERDALIRDLNSKREQLTALQQARTRLLASISHDLRQPLQAVRLYAEALLGLRPQPESQSIVQRQLRAADDAVDMLDQFSEFSAIEQGALKSEPRGVDVRELVDGVAESLRATHAAADISIHVHGRPAWVWADRSQLARVVQNLAGNAVRYSLHAAAGRPARVVLGVRPHARGVAIDVVDNGLGIPADKLGLVFEPYVQLQQASGARAGRGLGLAIVRGLVHQLGLQLAPVRSVPGRGTRFRVVVPPALMREAPEPAPKLTAPAAQQWLWGRMLAVLDDEDAARDALATALRSAGAHVVEAGDFATLRSRLDDEVRFPDALVFDLDLRSDLDGVDTLRALREAWQTQVPAVIVTGRAPQGLGVSLPAHCVLISKPVSLADLVGALEAMPAVQVME